MPKTRNWSDCIDPELDRRLDRMLRQTVEERMMVKEKEGSTETTTPKKRKIKPETLLKKAIEKKFLAWCEINDISTKDQIGYRTAFFSGVELARNGVFKKVGG